MDTKTQYRIKSHLYTEITKVFIEDVNKPDNKAVFKICDKALYNEIIEMVSNIDFDLIEEKL